MSEFNVILRRKNRVDLLVPHVSGVRSYNLQTDVLPISGSFTTDGTFSAVPVSRTSQSEFGNNAYFSFNPDEFVTDLDKRTFYVRLQPVTSGGPGTPGPLKAIAPPTDANLPPEVINETATTTITRIPFSRTTISLSIINLDGTNGLLVSFEEGGTEVSLPNQTDEYNDQGNFDAIYVRSDAGTCDFQVVAILSSGDQFRA